MRKSNPKFAFTDIRRISIACRGVSSGPFELSERICLLLLMMVLMLMLSLLLAAPGNTCTRAYGEVPAVTASSNGTHLLKMLFLHVPRSGGSTICGQWKKLGMSSSNTNCWERNDGPEWIYPLVSKTHGPRSVIEPTCADRIEGDPPFTMLERYLDTAKSGKALFCGSSTLYVTVLRDPVNRCLSHVAMYARISPPRTFSTMIKELSPKTFIRTIETLESSEPFSTLGKTRVMRVLFPHVAFTPTNECANDQRYSACWETELRHIAAFTSSYLVRMLLGKRLGNEPLIGVPASNVSSPGILNDATNVLRRFDAVLFFEDIDNNHAVRVLLGVEQEFTQTLSKMEKRKTKSRPMPRLNRTPSRLFKDPFFRQLSQDVYLHWIELRSRNDIALYKSFKRVGLQERTTANFWRR